jgi:hypothetical protein
VFTPGVAYALHGVAPDCVMKRDTAGELWTCTGRPGTILITTDTADPKKLRAIQIDLKSMTLPQAKAHLGPALQPVLAAGTDTMIAELSKLRTGERTSLVVADAKLDIVAGGKSTIAPEYSFTLRW